jgi:hypothetical protein
MSVADGSILIGGNIRNVLIPQTSSADLTRDLFGFDVLERPYKAYKKDWEAIIAGYPVNMPDKEFPGLTFAGYKVSGGKVMTDLTLIFKGLKTGKPPDPIPTAGISLQSASLPTTHVNDAGDGYDTIQASYFSPETTWRWITSQAYPQPIASVLYPAGFSMVPFNIVPAYNDGSYPVYQYQVQISGYKSELVGSWWQNECTASVIIVPGQQPIDGNPPPGSFSIQLNDPLNAGGLGSAF